MNSILRNDIVTATTRRPLDAGERLASVREWIERAHARRPRQEFWRWLHAQLRAHPMPAN